MKYLPLLSSCLLAATVAGAADLRIGIIGSDTSHVPAFTKLFNDATDPNHVPGGKVTVLFKSGSPDIESSWSRVDQYATEVQEKFGVRLVDSVAALCKEVDVVLLESVDGRPHLEQARPVIQAGKPLFVDKPVAGTLRDAIELYRLAQANRVPVFTSSAYRYYRSLVDLRQQTQAQKIKGAISYGPCELEPHHPDFFWYGIHPTEALFTIMGPGCQSVVRVNTADTDVATGIWADGRTGVLYGVRNSWAHQVIAFGEKGVLEQKEGGDSYAPLVVEIMKFFQTGIAPVSPEESLEIYAFMEAADESKRQGGKPVKISDVMEKNGGAGMLSTSR
ncbi:MAG: Gfo/Idh/MocA family oxidoreductase [Verrucomicrobiae bacterium]|nr:Gfo/Idh/MocA family oxidoreductase [Verrucomicrobiae bacterium]